MSKDKELIYVNLLSKDHKSLIDFYANVVGLDPVDDKADPSAENWYGFKSGEVGFAIEPMSNRNKYRFEYAKGNPVLIQFKADSVSELQEWTDRLEENEVVIGQKMMEKSYGVVTTFVDPDGNVIELLFQSR